VAVPKQYAQSCGIGVILIIVLFALFLAFGGVHSSDPYARLIFDLFLPGVWVATKAFPSGVHGDLPATLLSYAIDILLFGAVVMICWRAAISLKGERQKYPIE
jgi:hypothetical protein